MKMRRSKGLQLALIFALTGFVLLSTSSPASAIWNPFAKPKTTNTRTVTTPLVCSVSPASVPANSDVTLSITSGTTSNSTYDWTVTGPIGGANSASIIYTDIPSSFTPTTPQAIGNYDAFATEKPSNKQSTLCHFSVTDSITTLSPPTFSPTNGATFTSTLAVNLSSSTSGATIRYTLTTDGTNPPEPTSSSTQYSAPTPITLSQTSTIRAKAFLNSQSSPSNFATYTKVTSPQSDPLTCSISPTVTPAGGGSTTVTFTNGTPNYNIYWGLPGDPENIGSATSATKQYTNATSTDVPYTIQANDATSATKVDCGTLTVKGTSKPPPPINATVITFGAVDQFDPIRPNWDNFKNATDTDQTFSDIYPGNLLGFAYAGQAPNDNCKLVTFAPDSDTITSSITTTCIVYSLNPRTLSVTQDADYQFQAVGDITVKSGKIKARVANVCTNPNTRSSSSSCSPNDPNNDTIEVTIDGQSSDNPERLFMVFLDPVQEKREVMETDLDQGKYIYDVHSYGLDSGNYYYSFYKVVDGSPIYYYPLTRKNKIGIFTNDIVSSILPYTIKIKQYPSHGPMFIAGLPPSPPPGWQSAR